MTKLFSELVTAGLIGNLNGDDGRLAKIEQAATALAQSLAKAPKELMRAVLAGLDPCAREDDPALRKAEEALLAQWKTMRSVHPDAPVQLERAILLEACAQAAESEGNDAIVWLVAADTLPRMRLSPKEGAVGTWLKEIAMRMEKRTLPGQAAATSTTAPSVVLNELGMLGATTPYTIDRASLRLRVAAAVGPQDQQGQTLSNPNPHWTNAPANWSHEFTSRMHTLLAEELDAVAVAAQHGQQHLATQLSAAQTSFTKSLSEALAAQQNWTREILAQAEAQRRVDQVRLDSLWWSEALYSSSLRCSYRELPPLLAAVVMALDLVAIVAAPAPASVGYLLMEAMRRVGGEALQLSALLSSLREIRRSKFLDWHAPLEAAPSAGHLCLRDLIALALDDQEWSPDEAIQRAGFAPGEHIDLPQLAHAMFRQEQAVRLAAGA